MACIFFQIDWVVELPLGIFGIGDCDRVAGRAVAQNIAIIGQKELPRCSTGHCGMVLLICDFLRAVALVLLYNLIITLFARQNFSVDDVTKGPQ